MSNISINSQAYCPKIQNYVPLSECEKCKYYDGIVVRDDRAFLRGLPNCDMVACKYDNHLRPIIHDDLKNLCAYCPIKDCPFRRAKNKVI